MELRPRRGRSTLAPSTPTVAKPSSRSSSSRKKQEPATPIVVLWDDDGDQHDIRVDERKDSGNSLTEDMTLPDNLDYSTPLPSIAKSYRARTSTRKSAAKLKGKVISPVTAKLEKAEVDSATSQDSTYVGGEASIESEAKVTIAASSEEKELDVEPSFENEGSRKHFELALERIACAENMQEAAVSGVLSEKLAVSTSSKKAQSIRKKRKSNGKFSDGKAESAGINEGMDDRSKKHCDQEHFVDDHAQNPEEGQGTLSLVLSEEETAEVSDMVDMGGLKAKVSHDNEAELVQNKVPASRMKRRKSLIKEVAHEEASPHLKIFEGRNKTAVNLESEGQYNVQTNVVVTSREEENRRSKGSEHEDGEERIQNCTRHEGTPLNVCFNKIEVLDFDEVECDVIGASVTKDEIERQTVWDTSLIASNVVSRTTGGTDEHQSKTDKNTDEVVVLGDEEDNLEDDEDSSSSDNDDGDDDEDEMASILVKSMKLHLQNSMELCYGMNKQQQDQAKEGEVLGAETDIQKAAAKVINGNNKSLSHGISWSPDTGLPTSISLLTQTGKAKGVQNGAPQKIWRKDGCLQDGLLVPPVDPRKLNKLVKKQKRDTKGEKWFNMSAPTITPELKKELQLVKLRGVLDPKRHYKAEDTQRLPKYFQVGTVVGGPADFYSGRLTKKEQKSSLADELLSNSSLTVYRKRKYMEIQDQKQAGGKGFWKQKKSKRTPAWAKI